MFTKGKYKYYAPMTFFFFFGEHLWLADTWICYEIGY